MEKLNTPELFINLGVIFEKLRDYELAVYYFEKAYSLKPSNQITFLAVL